MTQEIGNAFLGASPIPMLIKMSDVSTPSRDKSPSPELFSLIKAAASSLIGFKELWGSIKAKGVDEGFNEDQLMGYLKPLLKEKLTDMQIKYLTHEEYYKQKSKEQYQKRVILPDIAPKKDIEQTEYEALTEEEEFKKWEQNKNDRILRATAPEEIKQLVDEPEESKLDPLKDPEINRPILGVINDPETEDPKDLEISFLKEKVSELEEALKKTQQFKPATQLEPKPFLDDDIVIEYLKERAKETGEIIDFGRVGSGALVQRLAPYKNSFGVIELFGRIVTK